MKLLRPKKLKHKKYYGVFYKTKIFIRNKYFLQPFNTIITTKNNGYITAKHIEALRLKIRRISKKVSNFIICIKSYPKLPITKKSQGLRMGKGKGNVEQYVTFLKKNTHIYEFKRNFQIPQINNTTLIFPKFLKKLRKEREFRKGAFIPRLYSFNKTSNKPFLKKIIRNYFLSRILMLNNFVNLNLIYKVIRNNSINDINQGILYSITKRNMQENFNSLNSFYAHKWLGTRIFMKITKKLKIKTQILTANAEINKFKYL